MHSFRNVWISMSLGNSVSYGYYLHHLGCHFKDYYVWHNTYRVPNALSAKGTRLKQPRWHPRTIVSCERVVLYLIKAIHSQPKRHVPNRYSQLLFSIVQILYPILLCWPITPSYKSDLPPLCFRKPLLGRLDNTLPQRRPRHISLFTIRNNRPLPRGSLHSCPKIRR